MASEPAPIRKAGYHHGALAASATALAYDHVCVEVVAELSIRQLAAKLGVTPRAIYRHFGDKQGLISATRALAFDRLNDKLDDALDLQAWFAAYTKFALASPTRYRMMFVAKLTLDGNDELSHQLKRLIASAKKRDGMHFAAGAPSEPRERIMTLWGLCHGLIELYLNGSLHAASDVHAGRYIDERLADVIAGMRAR